MALAHAGLGIVLIGIVGVTACARSGSLVMKPGDAVESRRPRCHLRRATPFTGPNYTADRGRFVVPGMGRRSPRSNRRSANSSRPPGNERSRLHQFLTGDLYIVMGEGRCGGGRSVRIYSIRWRA
jgi:cytochrome c-type biogenesis protein CcmF